MGTDSKLPEAGGIKMNTNIKEQKGFNSYQWNNLTAGKLMCIHNLAVKAFYGGNMLAHDLCHDIENFAYSYPNTAIVLSCHKHDEPKVK